MDPILLVGNIALVCTIASNFSGLPICIGFFKNGSTSNVSMAPFLAGATCTTLWLMYSIILGDRMMQTVNVVAVFLQTSYVISYYINTHSKQKAKQLVFTVAAFLMTVYAYNFHIANETTAKTTAGFLASFGSILAYASPLVTVREVLKSKSSESLPFPIIFSSFIVASLWFYYGVLVEDGFVQVPNLIGAILSGFQLGLIAIYPAKKSKEDSKTD